MDQLKQIASKIAVYIVDYSIEWTNTLLSGIDVDEPIIKKSFSSGEQFIDFLNKSKLNKRQTHIALIGYTFFDEKNNTLMNGMEILESMKKIKPFINAVMLASQDEQEYGGYVKKMGALAVISKDENTIMRVNNQILILSSKHSLDRRKKDLRVSIVLWAVSVVLLFAWLILS